MISKGLRAAFLEGSLHDCLDRLSWRLEHEASGCCFYCHGGKEAERPEIRLSPSPSLGSLIDFFFLFRDEVSLSSLGYFETHSVDQAGLELRDLLHSAFLVLGLKVWATITQLI